MTRTENFARVEVASARELRTWLEQNHQQSESVWLVTWKKRAGARYVSRDDVLDELLAFGWIDGIRRKLDTDRTMQLISPRKAQHWARSYKERAARLEADGRMAPPGRRAIEASKAVGLWDFMDDVDALIRPDDLVEELRSNPTAAKRFDAFGPAVQRFALRWIKLARTPETRARRIRQTVERAARGEKVPGA